LYSIISDVAINKYMQEKSLSSTWMSASILY